MNNFELQLKNATEEILNNGPNASEAIQAFSQYVTLRVREVSIVDRLLPPDVVAYNEVTRDPNNPDNVFFHVYERGTVSGYAMTIPLGGSTAPMLIRETYYPVYFNVITTPTMKRLKETTGFLKQNLKDEIDKNLVEKIGDQKDVKFFNALNDCATSDNGNLFTAFTLKDAAFPGASGGELVHIFPFSEPEGVSITNERGYSGREILVAMTNFLSTHGNLKLGTYVMPVTVYNQVHIWNFNVLGDDIGKVTLGGLKSVIDGKTIFGDPVITTGKIIDVKLPSTNEIIQQNVLGEKPKKIEISVQNVAGTWEDEDHATTVADSLTDETASWMYAFATNDKLGKNAIIDKINLETASGLINDQESAQFLMKAWVWTGVSIANCNALAKAAIPGAVALPA